MIENNRQLIVTFRAMDGLMDNLMARANAGRPDDVPLKIWQVQHDALVSVVRELRGEIADYLERRGGLEQPGHAAGKQEAGHEEPAPEHDPARLAELGVLGSGDPPQDPADEGNHQDNPAHHGGDVAPGAGGDSSRARSRERAQARVRAIDGLAEVFAKLVAKYSLAATPASLRVLAIVAYDDLATETELLREKLAGAEAAKRMGRDLEARLAEAQELHGLMSRDLKAKLDEENARAASESRHLRADLAEARAERDRWKSANDRGIKHAALLSREMQAAYRRGRDEHRAYVEKMEEIARLMDIRPEPAAGSPEGERLRELAAEVEEYEQEHYPIGKPPTTRRT